MIQIICRPGMIQVRKLWLGVSNPLTGMGISYTYGSTYLVQKLCDISKPEIDACIRADRMFIGLVNKIIALL